MGVIRPGSQPLRLWTMSEKATYSIYVLQLDPALVPDRKRVPTDLGYLYVGMTSKTVADRHAQHQAGVGLAGKVFRDVVSELSRPLTDTDLWLRPDLVTVLANGDSKGQAESAERTLANKLKHAGYVVLSSHEHATKRAKAKSPRPRTG